MTYNYESESSRQRALQILNKGEEACGIMLKRIEEIKLELKKTRLDFVYVRTTLYGRGKGKTGKQKNLIKREPV